MFRTQTQKIENIKNSIISGIKPEVVLTQEHRTMIDAISTVWQRDSALARQMERAFVALCNDETHPAQVLDKQLTF